MSTPGDERAQRTEARRRRREEQAAGTDGAPDGSAEANPADEAGAPEGEAAARDGDTPATTVAKVAAAGAVFGAAVAAARAARSRSTGSEDDAAEARGEHAVAEREDDDGPASHEGDEREADDEKETDTVAEAAGDVPSELPVDREDGTGAAAEDDAETDTEADERPLSAAGRAVKRAVRQLTDLAGHEVEGVLGIRKTDDGWLVEVELVELERIPSTTDVLGAYDVHIDEDGDIQHYRRTRRYVRSQADRGGES